MNRITVNVKKLNKDALLPTYGSYASAGADLYAYISADLTVFPGETVMVPTGLSFEIPPGFAGLVCARSGLSVKKGLAPANKVGVIDSDYRGEIIVALFNHSAAPAVISPSERIAQILFVPAYTADFLPADELAATSRGRGGFGSTG